MAAFRCFVLALVISCVLLTPGLSQEIKLPVYHTVGDCDEICPLHPDTVCKLDCETVNIDGTGNECVDHFYDSDGNIVYHCWE